MTQRTSPHQSGYTLVELLLYMSLLGILLTGVVFFSTVVLDSRVKNQSITEVNTQGAQIMDTITQTIHNATSITAPASGISANSLTLVVPTGSLSPTVFDLSGTAQGATTDGGTTDTSNSNTLEAVKFTASASGTISSLNAFINTVNANNANNDAQMALYSGATPTTLLASSPSTVTLTPNTWNNFPIPTVSVTSGTTYWLVYNTNGSASTDNDLRYATGAAGISLTGTAQAFGAWPASFSGTSGTKNYSMYAMIDAAGTPAALRIKEGVGATVNLSDSNVQISGLTFRNLSRSGTTGIVEVSFNIGIVNPTNKNEYDYIKTFTASAEVGY